MKAVAKKMCPEEEAVYFFCCQTFIEYGCGLITKRRVSVGHYYQTIHQGFVPTLWSLYKGSPSQGLRPLFPFQRPVGDSCF